MNTQFFGRSCRALLSGAAAILCFLSASVPANSQQRSMQFTGGGFGPTIETAVRAATEDAENSASSMGFFNCVRFGEPLIFPGPDPKRHRNFTAEVTVECTQ